MTVIEVQGDGLAEARVRALVSAAIAAEGSAVSVVTVSFVDEATIKRLNHRHRGKDKVTDVLSYPFDGSFPHGRGGEVLVCTSVVGRLATRDGRDPAHALAETVIHGTLHLLGHDDATAAEARKMAERTERILEST